jgi:FkbM family methyltransferase
MVTMFQHDHPPMSESFRPFLEPEALRINAARLDHLDSLGLDLAGRRVLEVGAGIGLHTEFFERHGCKVLSTDGNPANVAEMMSRYPGRQLGVLDLDRSASLAALGRFDIVYCYGTLYHLRDPAGALARLAEICDGQLLVETLVFPGEHAECHRVVEPLTANQGIAGLGARPTRRWMMDQLGLNFAHAYTTLDQPDYPDFVTDWDAIDHYGNLRAVFIGSRPALELPSLTSELPRRHRNWRAPAAATVSADRVWIDVGAYQGEHSLAAARQDPTIVVHAFEPNPATCSALRGLPSNYQLHAAAIAEQDGMAWLRINRFAAASSLLPMNEQARAAWIEGDLLVEEGQVVVPTTRLDTFMAVAGIGRVEFLKIDAQGGDFAVVRSAGARLADIDRIQLEVAITPRQLYDGAANKETIVTFLEHRGFQLVEAQPQSHGQEENLLFVRNPIESRP